MPFMNQSMGMNQQNYGQYPNYQQQQAYPNWNRPPMPMPPQPMMQHNGLYGRIVNNQNDIQNNEIASDGSVTFFPTSDYSCIYAKAWDGNGNIQTVKYVSEETVSDLKTVIDKLNKIEKTISRFNKKSFNSNHSEVSTDE